MPPKNKKKQEDEDLGAMRAARFGRVKNTVGSLRLQLHTWLHADHVVIVAVFFLNFIRVA